MDRETRRSGRVDQVAALERLTGFHGALGRTLDFQGSEYGIALLSRWPITSDTVIQLPVDPPQERAGGVYEPRGAHRAVIVRRGGGIGVLNTHIDPSADDRYRLQEIATVIQAAGALHSTYPFTLVGGDLNAEPGSAVIARMIDAGWARRVVGLRGG